MHAATSRTDVNIDADTSKTFCIPLVSGIIGSMAEKTLPVGALTRDNMKVSITIADQLDLIAQANPAPGEISHVELVYEYVMVNDTVARALESMNSKGTAYL